VQKLIYKQTRLLAAAFVRLCIVVFC